MHRRIKPFAGKARWGLSLLPLAALSFSACLAMDEEKNNEIPRTWSLHESQLPYGIPEIKKSEILFSAHQVAPTDRENMLLSLRFIHLREHPSLSGPGEVTLQFHKEDGAWQAQANHASADYNQRSENSAELLEWTWDDESLAFSGKVAITIGPDSPRPRTVGIPNPADEYILEVQGQVNESEILPYLPLREASMAPWRVQTPIFSGYLVEGTYQGILKTEDQSLEGELVGGYNYRPQTGRIGFVGPMTLNGSPSEEEGLPLLARLPEERVASHHAAQARYLLGPEDPQNWEDWSGLRLTVSSPSKLAHAGILLTIQEDEGTSYSVNHAAPLAGEKVTVTIPFSDFRGGTGGTYFLDLDRVRHLDIGINNPFGIGDIPFALHKVELVGWDPAYRDLTKDPVDISLDPNRIIGQEGAYEVPSGLFGFHQVGGIRDPREGEVTAEEHLASLNPGFLRPLTHTGFNARPISDEEVAERLEKKIEEEPDSAIYRLARAGNAVDHIIWCHTQDLWNRPSWMDNDLEGFLENVFNFYRRQAAGAWTPGDDFNLLRRFEVWNEPFMWGRHFNMGHRQPPNRRTWEDPTQHGYIPAEKGMAIYSDIFLAAARGARSANPHVLLGGPSAPSFNSDAFSVLEDHVIPFLDAAHEEIDFLAEHHYGGYRQTFAASFDVATAYMDTRFNKRVPIYNTEANDLGGNSLDKAHYNIEDILASIMAAPDRNLGRALHALWDGYLRNQGERDAYRILSTLRGKILDLRTSDPRLMGLASSPQDDQIVVFLFNNSRKERELNFPFPAEFSLDEAKRLVGGDNLIAGERVGDIEGMDVQRGSGDTVLERLDPETFSPEGLNNYPLPSRAALRLTLSKEDYRPEQKENWQQVFADAVLSWVAPGESLETNFNWDGRLPSPENIQEVRLRLITHDVHRGEGTIAFGEHELPLPRSSSNFDDAVIQEIPLPEDQWSDLESAEFRSVDFPAGNGFRVLSASLRILLKDEN
ncbi:MAG: hypothetical protein LAT55_01260 [Opitutales bacterium]|nr:hypothetical protein [Opitutales bacterium]